MAQTCKHGSRGDDKGPCVLCAMEAIGPGGTVTAVDLSKLTGLESIDVPSIMRAGGWEDGRKQLLAEILVWLRDGAGEVRAKGTVAWEDSVMPIYRELADAFEAKYKREWSS